LKVVFIFPVNSVTGASSNDTADIAERANAAARRDLQRLVEQTHADDPLRRYSALLMTFHTLFSIHSGMLQSLFCGPLASRMASGAELFLR
jgi:hypothetical protein